MNRSAAGAARRYARALLDVALAQQSAPAVRRELDATCEALRAHRDLAAVLTHPALAAEKKLAIVRGVFGKRLEQAPVRRLLELLAERHRFELLPEIARAFVEEWNQARGVVAAELVSAEPLDADQKRGVAQALGKLVEREVEIHSSRDASLLGGVLVRMAGRSYDGSVAGRLRALRRQLLGTRAH